MIEPFFLQSEQGALFSLYFAANNKTDQVILFIPPFAEELNCSRYVIAQQCRILAMQGYSVLWVDLWGTGDSEGEFSEATWEIWQANIALACEYLQERGAERVIFWGLRLGGLLAMDCIKDSILPVEKLILWQPVLQGKLFINQFIRLKVAASKMNAEASPLTSTVIYEQIAAGDYIEVAGYTLNPLLIQSICAKQATALDFKVKEILLLVNNDLGNQSNQAFIEKCNNQQISIIAEHCVEDAFWMKHQAVNENHFNHAMLNYLAD